MGKRKFSKGTLIIVTIVVVGVAVAYYFWESYLYSHYLGGFDQYGLPIQVSYIGYYFLLYAWPVWVFPVIVALLVVWAWYARKAYVIKYKVHRLKEEIAEKHKAVEGLQRELEDVQEQLERVKQKPKKTPLEQRLQRENQKLEEEFVVLMEEYQQSQQFIEKLLEQIKS